MLGTKSLRSTACPNIATSPIATKIEATASTTGISAEVTAPKTNAKIIMATEIPIVSPVTKSCSANS